MENSTTQTNSTPQTSNPQDAASAGGASNSADFQSTAPKETLNQEAESLSVQQTGEPLKGVTASVMENGLSTIVVLTVIVLVVIGGWILYKLLREAVEENTEPAPKAKATVAKKTTTAKKAPAIKSAVKKKSTSAQRKKKSTAKK